MPAKKTSSLRLPGVQGGFNKWLRLILAPRVWLGRRFNGKCGFDVGPTWSGGDIQHSVYFLLSALDVSVGVNASCVSERCGISNC